MPCVTNLQHRWKKYLAVYLLVELVGDTYNIQELHNEIEYLQQERQKLKNEVVD